jgi:hypothetical protein
MKGKEKLHMAKYEEITNDWNYNARRILRSRLRDGKLLTA